LKRVIQEAESLGLQNVKLTGGEPLLYQRLGELIEFLKSEALGITLETNGTRITPKMIEIFRRGGVSQAAVSLDAASESIHDALRGVKGAFRKTLTGLRRLADSGIPFQIIFTLQQKNRTELQAVIQLCETLKANSLKINHLIPCGRGKDRFDQMEHLSVSELMALQEQARKYSGTVDVIFDLPVAFRHIDEIKRKGICECAILNIMGILSNGDYSLCGIGQTEPALRMGNIQYHPIRDIWDQHPLLLELRGSLPAKLEGICRECIFRFQCKGACRANAYATHRDLFAPNFLCQSLYDTNRFPLSRHVPAEECP
jgi:SynChlorMet cassette radical SAM/SPASM protein ScmF